MLERSSLPLNGLPDGRMKQAQATAFAREGGNGVTSAGIGAVQGRVRRRIAVIEVSDGPHRDWSQRLCRETDKSQCPYSLGQAEIRSTHLFHRFGRPVKLVQVDCGERVTAHIYTDRSKSALQT